MSIYPTSIHVRRQGEKKRACCARCMFVNSLNTKYTTHTHPRKNNQTLNLLCDLALRLLHAAYGVCVCVLLQTLLWLAQPNVFIFSEAMEVQHVAAGAIVHMVRFHRSLPFLSKFCA